MSVSKDTNKETWTVYARYTDWQGKVKILHKRGFKTKREALEYEREYLLKKVKDVNMGFSQFVESYLEDLKPRLKYNTYLTKEHIIRTKILPYFEEKHWQIFVHQILCSGRMKYCKCVMMTERDILPLT